MIPWGHLNPKFMSTTSGVTSSSSASYATELAETSQLRRSLNNLGTAIQSGNLSSASSILSAIIKAHPEYTTTSSSDTSTTSTSPINTDFQTLAKALDASDADAAKTAWTQLKSDMAAAGVTDLSDGKADTAKLLAETKTSVNEAIISNMFGVSASSDSSVATLIGDSSSSDSSSDAVSSAISSWLTYEADGKTSTSSSTTSTLNTAA
jgi:hypothetical protein